jgi:hypothetical protein
MKHPMAIGANRNQIVLAVDRFALQPLDPHLVMGFSISSAKFAISFLEIECTNLAAVSISLLTFAGEFRVANSLFYSDVANASFQTLDIIAGPTHSIYDGRDKIRCSEGIQLVPCIKHPVKETAL